MIQQLVKFIINNTTTGNSVPEIIRVLEKSSILVYDSRNCIIANEAEICYLVVQDVKFFLRNRDYLYNKVMWTSNQKLIDKFSAEVLEVLPDGMSKCRTVEKVNV